MLFTAEQKQFILEQLTNPEIVRILGTQEDPKLVKKHAYERIRDAYNQRFLLCRDISSIQPKIWRIRKHFIDIHIKLAAENDPEKRRLIQEDSPAYSKLYEHYKHSPVWVGAEKAIKGRPKLSCPNNLRVENPQNNPPIDKSNNNEIECQTSILVNEDSRETTHRNHHINCSSDHSDNPHVGSMTLNESNAQDPCQGKSLDSVTDTFVSTLSTLSSLHYTSEDSLSRHDNELQDYCPSKVVTLVTTPPSSTSPSSTELPTSITPSSTSETTPQQTKIQQCSYHRKKLTQVAASFSLERTISTRVATSSCHSILQNSELNLRQSKVKMLGGCPRPFLMRVNSSLN